MFVGSITHEAQYILKKILQNVSREQPIYVGCSGNYTIERLLSSEFQVHSNDVSLYSLLIADILLGKETPIKVKNQELQDIYYTWENTKYKNFIFILFLLKISEYHKKLNLYQEQMWIQYIENNVEYYKKNIVNIESHNIFNFKILDFYYGDVVDYMRSKNGKGIGVIFPPTYKGGYEKIYKFIDESVEYPKATYEIFDPKKQAETYKSWLENDTNIIYTDKEIDDLKYYLKAKIIYPNKHDIFLYSSVNEDNSKYYIIKKNKFKSQNRLLLESDYIFTKETKIGIEQVAPDMVNYYKDFFMSLKVNYSLGGDNGLLFLANDKIFGFASFSKRLSNLEYCFLHADFTIYSTQKHLSKLVLYILKSNEVRDILCDWYETYYKGIKTSVYTDKPVSMKYRGAFNLLKREKGKLIYIAEFTGLDIKQMYNLWLDKLQKM